MSIQSGITGTGNFITAPEEEQAICVRCGFCCDGTLFLQAHLNKGERGHLPEGIERDSFAGDDGKEFFRLPCRYFDVMCMIYDRQRADVCSSFRCQLLRDCADAKISPDDALKTVQEARILRDAIVKEYLDLTGKARDVCFRQILIDLGRLMKRGDMGRNFDGKMHPDAPIEMLLVRCNIFEALLIRHFRSTEDFEKMIMY